MDGKDDMSARLLEPFWSDDTKFVMSTRSTISILGNALGDVRDSASETVTVIMDIQAGSRE